MGVYQHEDLIIDLTNTTRTKLYKADKLVFIGDGFKAITMMISNAEDKQPIKDKFSHQLNTREKPKFTKEN